LSRSQWMVFALYIIKQMFPLPSSSVFGPPSSLNLERDT
jgi:hypothetical protein